MHASILKYISDIRASYWFIPSLIALMAVVMSIILTTIDSKLGINWLREVSWLYVNQPAGARAVLSTIAGSMITVAGVTFSMTIVAVSYATSQLGPRLIRNFMRDRSTQITLGVFIGTFIYCLLVLRTVRDANNMASNTSEAITVFVPHLAILFAIISALISVAMLIHFVHHIPESINVSNLTAKIGKEMINMIDTLFPQKIGELTSKNRSQESKQTIPDDIYSFSTHVKADFNGYIQVLDEQKLMDIATEHDLIIRVEYRPGDFVTEGKTIMLILSINNVKKEVVVKCREIFAYGIERTPNQNIMFLVDQLVEIIARALSPGVNDPFTANLCIDWLQAMFTNLIKRDCPSPYREDDNGNIRAIVYPISFERILELTLDQIRPYVSSDRIASLRLMKMIADIAVDLPDQDVRTDLLLSHATKLKDAAIENLALTNDKDEVNNRYTLIRQIVEDNDLRDKMRDDQLWLEGSA